MRAWMLRRTGGPDALRLEELPEPSPGPGEVLVDVEAIGVNYAEVLSRKGLYGWAPERPYVPGMECAGRVAAVGPGVRVPSPGDPVICGMKHGAYAERVVVPAARALPARPGFSMEENAAFLVSFMTAWVSLMEMARLRPSDRVAVTAAAGGLGTAAVQIALAHGCRVVAMAGATDKLARVRELGAHAMVNYRRHDFEARFDEAVVAVGRDGVRRIRWDDIPPDVGEEDPVAEGLDVVLEVVGGAVFRACRARLAPFGRIVVAGYAGLDYRWWNPLSWWRAWRDAPHLHVGKAAEDSVGVLATHLGYLLPDDLRFRVLWRDLSAFVEDGDLRPVVGATYPFEDLPRAHALMESRESVGKIVVRVV